jgi:hypothetical protein
MLSSGLCGQSSCGEPPTPAINYPAQSPSSCNVVVFLLESDAPSKEDERVWCVESAPERVPTSS